MTTTLSADSVRLSGDYAAAVATMAQAMTDLGGTLRKQQPETGVVEASWRYGVNPWGLRVTAQFRRDGADTIVTVRGGFKDSFSTVKAPRLKAEAVLARFRERMDMPGAETPSSASPAGPLPPQLGDGVTAHRGKSKTTTALLALLLGGLGVHRFYLGTWGLGLVFLGLTLLLPGAGF
ncbi:NINE protein, partial [Novispirillum sp. DQ9]|uniref:NINE protein n=1 Tax=Novispirillum sp. DQ9 TaxID=3398612 RepID=UPI003C7AD901